MTFFETMLQGGFLGSDTEIVVLDNEDEQLDSHVNSEPKKSSKKKVNLAHAMDGTETNLTQYNESCYTLTSPKFLRGVSGDNRFLITGITKERVQYVHDWYDNKSPYAAPVTEDSERVKYCKKISACGTWAKQFNPINGIKTNVRTYCEQWRKNQHGDYCPVCFELRVSELVQHIAIAARVKGKYAVTDSASAKDATKDLGRENYLRIPGEDGTTIVFWRDDGKPNKLDRIAMPFAVETPQEFWKTVLSFNWDNFGHLPKHQNISGTLGVAEYEEELLALPEKDQEPRVMVYVKSYSDVDIEPEDKKIVEKAFETATVETAFLDPTTLEDLQYAINKREQVFEEILSKISNGSINKKLTYKTSKVYVKFSLISWLPVLMEKFGTYSSRGYFSYEECKVMYDKAQAKLEKQGRWDASKHVHPSWREEDRPYFD